MVRRTALLSLALLLLLGLPLLGVSLEGKPLAPYLEIDPPTERIEPAPFSWRMFSLLVLVVVVVVGPIGIMAAMAPKPPHVYLTRVRPLPWWGWLGLGFLAVAWVLAWTRFSWFEPVQPHTFTPLWVGYIIVINALAFKRTGHCMMLNRIGFFLSLFPASAALWWFFEYLNRFVHNWYYVGAIETTTFEYVLHGSLAFSTVLPAVIGTNEWLRTFPGLDGMFRDLLPIEFAHPTVVAWVVLVLASGGLLGIGIWPEYLSSLLWLSPLFIITSLQALLGEDTIFSRVREGDWRLLCLSAIAGLICGFFWELWNSQSFSHWVYTVPLVQRFHIFEMPLIGYAGYLPFGWECVVVAGLLPGGGVRETGPD